jgi:hypothetical protein
MHLPHLFIAGIVLVAFANRAALAQKHPYELPPRPGEYTPLDQHEVPGKYARWNLIAKPQLAGYFQPVQINLPGPALVSFFSPEHAEPMLTQAPALAGMLIGPVYRFRVAGMPGYPGVEIFPTVEVVDRMHPPAGREHEFPIPVDITESEIEAVLGGQMVTKVVYLEQPQTASVLEGENGTILTYDLPPTSNSIDTALQLGRPMAILRIGGRVPDPRDPNDPFFTHPAPIRVMQ